MQFNTTAALVSALVSAIIGFGLAFYLERKLSNSMQKKSQKILTSLAMISFGYGLMATLNEVVGLPLQGIQTRHDKLVGYILANILFLPIVFLAVAKLIGLKNKVVVDVATQSNQVERNFFKYFLVLTGVLSIAYFGYVKMEEGKSSSNATYDFYDKVDFKNCNSPFESSPSFSLKFLFKKETNEIFMTVEFDEKGVKKQEIQKLDNCSVMDAKNWTCGGEWIGSYKQPKYMFIDGAFSYDIGISSVGSNCDIKVVKR
jgi:hypothetical protein